MEQPLVYENPGSHACIRAMSPLFRGLGKKETVQALVSSVVGKNGYESITQVHNNLSSCNTWSKVQDWSEEVEYTITHPRGDVYAYDTKSTGTRLRTIETKDRSFLCTCQDGKTSACVRRIAEKEVDHIDFSTTRFSWVKVMNVKRFFYESARSSFVYRLVVLWEGVTKDEAKRNGIHFKMYLETNDAAKLSGCPEQSLVSFMEKTIDLLSNENENRQVLAVEPCEDFA